MEKLTSWPGCKAKYAEQNGNKVKQRKILENGEHLDENNGRKC